jgi:hypothetical protein
MTPTSIQYILKEEGIFKQQMYEVPIINSDQIISSLLSHGFIGVPFPMAPLNKDYSSDSYILFTATTPKRTLVVCELRYLLFPGAEMFFNPNSGRYGINPVALSCPYQTFMQPEPLKWYDSNTRIFLMTYHKDDRIIENYFFMIYKNTIIKPPYPNIYEDMRVCMGSSFNRNIANPARAATKSLNHFCEEPMNKDLFNPENCRRFFVFDGDGVPLPLNDDIVKASAEEKSNDLTRDFLNYYNEYIK